MEETKTTRLKDSINYSKDFRIATLKDSINYLKRAGYTIDICDNRFIGFEEDENEAFYIDTLYDTVECSTNYGIDCYVIGHALNIVVLFKIFETDAYDSEEDLCKSIYETIHNIDPEFITVSSIDD